jgi:hypothetical protein
MSCDAERLQLLEVAKELSDAVDRLRHFTREYVCGDAPMFIDTTNHEYDAWLRLIDRTEVASNVYSRSLATLIDAIREHAPVDVPVEAAATGR